MDTLVLTHPAFPLSVTSTGLVDPKTHRKGADHKGIRLYVKLQIENNVAV